MVLAGTWGSLPCFENDVAFAVPDVARIASVPRPNATSSHRVSEPLLDDIATVHQVAGAQGSAGPAAARHSGKSYGVLVVGTPDVTARFSHLRQVDAVRRHLYPARLRVVTLECRSPHDASCTLYAFRIAHDVKSGAFRNHCWTVVQADASGPNGSTPAVRCFVSGVSTPMSRTVSCAPSIRTRMMSPSMTRSTWAVPDGAAAVAVASCAARTARRTRRARLGFRRSLV